MTPKNSLKRFQIILAISLTLGTSAVMMAYSSQPHSSHSQARMEQAEVGEHEDSEAREASETAESQEKEALEADEAQEAPETGEKASQASRIPASLWTVSENGEDVYDSAKARNWGQAQKQLAALQQAQRKLPADVHNAQSQLAGVHTGLTALEQAIAKQNQLMAMDAANQITLHAIQMTQQFHLAQPVELSMLDYLGRELELGALSKDQPRMKNATSRITQTWHNLKPRIKSHGGNAQVQNFDTLIQKLNASKTQQETLRLASDELAAVDHLEAVFEK